MKDVEATYDSYIATGTTVPVYVHASMFFGLYQNYCFLDDTKTGPSAVPDSAFALPPICKRSPTTVTMQQHNFGGRVSMKQMMKENPVPFPALDSCFGWPFVAPGN